MRLCLFSAIALLAVGLLDVRSASAAWSCVGPEFVCATPRHAAPPRRAARAYPGKPRYAVRGRRHRAHAKATVGPRHARKIVRASPRRGIERKVVRSLGGGGQTGVASYYWQGQRVASGGRFNPNALTAAHRTLPFGTRVRVTSVSSGRSVDVTINDRGPFIRGRVIDLSRAAAGVIGMRGAGLARVRLNVIGRK